MKRKVIIKFLCVIILSVPLFIKQVVAQGDPSSGDNTMQFNRNANSSVGSGVTLGSGANLNVELYTGKLQASLPIFTLESSDLKIPISIDYTAGSGVRQSDLNTPVGLGWGLNAGGSVTRAVRGLPDESAYGYIGTNNKGLNVVTDFNTPSNGLALSFNNIYNSEVASSPPVDGEPDIFFVQTPSFNFKFTIDQNGQVVMSGNTGFTITHGLYKNTGNALNTSFVVTDDLGNQYYFGSSAASREFTITKFFSQSFTFVSTWYLDKIVTYNARDLVTFTYMQGQNDTIYNYSLSKSYTSTFASSGTFPPPGSPTSFSSQAARTVTISTTIFSTPKYISQINTKLGEADFVYTYSPTVYINSSNPPKLTSIVVKQLNSATNLNSTIKTFGLNFTEFQQGISGATQPYQFNGLWSDYYKRLLSTVTVTGTTTATSSPVTLFTLKYNRDLPYPNREMVQNCDYWGFINSTTFQADGGTNGGIDINYFTSPDGTRQPTLYNNSQGAEVPTASLLALTEIDNLLGESALINYELNTYYNGSSNQNVGGCRVASLYHNLADGQQLYTNFTYNNATGNSTGQIYNDFYKRVMLYFGTACCNFNTLAFSQSPYPFQDENGIFVGYSTVTAKNKNGGSEVDNFTNFSDYPDNLTAPSLFATSNYNSNWRTDISSIVSSFAYKRGLPKSKIIYTNAHNPVSETDYVYGSLDAQPTVKVIGLQDMTWWLAQGGSYGTSTGMASINVYNSNIENWRLLQTVKKDYDQNTVANALVTTTSYGYCADERLIKTITVSDSKGQNFVKTFYHANDANIPNITASEQTAANAMVTANRISPLIHEVDNRNSATTYTHNSFATFTNLNGITNIYLAKSTYFNNTTQVKQQLFNYDIATSNLSSTNNLGGKSSSFVYGYNSVYPIAKIDNASSTSAVTSQQSTGGGSCNFSSSSSFSTSRVGSITFSISFSNYPGSSNTTQAAYTLTGPSNQSGNLCFVVSGSGTCSYPNTVTFTNMPAGNYTISATGSSTYPSSNPYLYYTYPALSNVITYTNDYFIEGFEQNQSATSGAAHTGNMYWNGNYTVTYAPADGKTYMIQWWNLTGGVWNFNEQAYTQNMLLTGPVDDIRVFPVDALVTSYTYSPLIGKTSETDPSGKSVVYNYDGLGRLLTVVDQDNNVLKEYDYQYQYVLQPPTVQITITNATSQVGYSATFTNTVTGLTYSSTLTPTGGSVTLPPGNYNVTVTTTLNGGIIASFCSSFAQTPTGKTVTLSNLNVSATGCLTLTVDSDQ